VKQLKKLLTQALNEKFRLDPGHNVDSLTQRAQANASNRLRKGGPNKQQANGADIAKKMDFDQEPQRSVYDTQPLSVMDVVMQMWGLEGEEEEEVDDES